MRLFDPGIKLIQALSDSHSERNIMLRRAKLSIVITRFSIQYAASVDTALLHCIINGYYSRLLQLILLFLA